MNVSSTIVLIAYLVLTVSLAFYWGKKKTKTSEDYTVGARSFSTPILFFTLLATIVGASSVIGYTGWYYKRGLSQWWFILGIALCYVLYIYYLGPRINKFGREHGGQTVGDWLQHRYGSATNILGSLIIVIGYLAITAFQYMAMARIFSMVTGMNNTVALIITALIVIVYTSFGGLWAVASTDVLQGAMTLVGLLIMAPAIVSRAGGLSTVFASVPATHLQPMGYITPITALAYALVFLLGIISWPDVWQRCYAAKSKKALKTSLWLFIIAFIIIACLTMTLGFSAYKLYPNYATPESILQFMVLDQFPGVIGALFLSVLLAVIMGTADSTLLVSSIIVERDFYSKLRPNATDKERLMAGKISTFACGIVVLLFAAVAPSMFDLWVMSADLMGATLAVPILIGMTKWKKPSPLAGIMSIVCGLVGWVLSYTGLIAVDAIILGAAFSLVGYLIVCFVKPAEKVLEPVK